MAPISKKIEHLKKDKVLAEVISRSKPVRYRINKDLYFGLLRAIAGQQLSVKSAESIWNRFLKLFKDGYPHPKTLLRLKDTTLRKAGMSHQKAGYLKNIARFSIEKTLDYDELKSKTDEELIGYLNEIKGVGRWTVEMMLIFVLNRPDVFPIDDLGIQNSMKKLYHLKPKSKKALYKKLNAIAEKWKPYRSLGSKYIWSSKDIF